MPTLSAMDLAMFVLESPERPFNIGPLVLLRPPAKAKPAAFADKLRKQLLQRPPGAALQLPAEDVAAQGPGGRADGPA